MDEFMVGVIIWLLMILVGLCCSMRANLIGIYYEIKRLRAEIRKGG